MNQCHCSRESTECSVLTRLKQTQKHKKRCARVRAKCHIKHRENKARGWSRSTDKKMIWVREKKTDTSKERDSAGGRWSRLRWMEKKTAAARQDNFSHFSVGGQRVRGDVTRWSVTEWQRGRRGGEQEITQDVWKRVKEGIGEEDRKGYTETRYAPIHSNRKCVCVCVCEIERETRSKDVQLKFHKYFFQS